jgi:hypothetical protein
MRKTWKITSTNERVKSCLNKTCRCKEEHAQARGKDGKAKEKYTKDLVEAIVQCLLEEKVEVKPVKRPLSKEELERHQRNGHNPYNSLHNQCLLAGIKDKPRYRRTMKEKRTH